MKDKLKLEGGLPNYLDSLGTANKSKSKRGINILKWILFACIVLQSLALLPKLISDFRGNKNRIISNKNKYSVEDIEWKDDTWPIRELTPWDISTDFPYPRKLEYEVTEGTWLRLDVHPVSGDIVFDMLGDLYCLPAESYRMAHTNNAVHWQETEAKLILGGIPHDSDPHFSPDGRLLVFRSDAGLGVENVWVRAWDEGGCGAMDVRARGCAGGDDDGELARAVEMAEHDEKLLLDGVREDGERRRRRLIREGRAGAHRVTNETFRFITDPRFHPSGKSIIATKWYTSERSLGAGEGWEYDVPDLNSDSNNQRKISVGAGAGKRLVGRTLPSGWSAEQYGEQQIGPEQFIWAGEKGDGVIYAMNVVDVGNGVFEYSKDVHSGIYAIFAHNLTTNETDTLVSRSPGGASRPELSRDGRTLAFVRRVRDKEALVLKDLHTGTIHHIWYGLTYDLSTISAPMGTYPSFAFTPDDSAIIIWASGKINYVPLKENWSGERVLDESKGAGKEGPRVIPFKAKIEKRLAETRTRDSGDERDRKAMRELYDLETGDVQPVNAFSSLDIDEEGKRVVVSGAGASYVRDLDGDETVRVNVLHPIQAYYTPSFVPGTNGRMIIHATWGDKEFSTFEIADLESGRVYEVKRGLPLGRYRAPTVCACKGKERKLAFVKTAGDLLTGDVVAVADPGLYIGGITLPGLGSPGEIEDSSRELKDLRYVKLRGAQVDMGDNVLKMRFLNVNGAEELLIEQSQESFVVELGKGPDAFGRYGTRVVVQGRMSREISVPSSVAVGGTDGEKYKYAAFIDFYNVYILKNASLSAGEKLWSKPGRAPAGLARVSLDGGHDVRWSAEGGRVVWMLGKYIHVLDVKDLSKCEDAIKEDEQTFGISCTKNLLKIKEINASYRTDIYRLKEYAKFLASNGTLHPKPSKRLDNADVLVLTNASVLTMESGRMPGDFVERARVVVRGGVVESVRSVTEGEEVPVPEVLEGAEEIDLGGGFVLPGFIDMHAHWGGFGNVVPARSWELKTFLAYGVTTLHNPSSDNVAGYTERSLVESGYMIGPRIYHTGNVIYGAGSPGIFQGIVDDEEARSALVRIKAEGGAASFSYKNYNLYSRASRQRLLLAARNLSMLCVPEGGMNQDWDLTYIIDGMTTVEHALPIPKLYKDVKTLFALSGTGYTPTHIVNYGGTWGEQLVYSHVEVVNDPKLRRFTRHDILESLEESTSRPIDSYQFFNTSASIVDMVAEGLKTFIGAHGEAPKGFNYHSEMHFAKMGGLDNFEVFRAATSDAAKTLGLDDLIGSLAPGKLADLVIYPPGVNLLAGTLAPTRDIRYVMRGGRMWEAETMVEVWPRKGLVQAGPIINAD